MTRVAVWGSWAKLCCTPRLWEALSAVSTESWLAGRRAQRTAQAGSRLFLGTLASYLCLCPCSVPVAGSGPTMHAHCRPGEVVPASQDEPIPWCGCARQASEGVLIQSPSRSRARSTQRATCKNFISHLESLKCYTTCTWTTPAERTVGKVGMCRCWPSKPWAWAAWQLSTFRLRWPQGIYCVPCHVGACRAEQTRISDGKPSMHIGIAIAQMHVSGYSTSRHAFPPS